MQKKVLNGFVYEICEIYIDDVLIHGKIDAEFLRNIRRVFERLRAKNVAVNLKKTKLGFPEVEYVGHDLRLNGLDYILVTICQAAVVSELTAQRSS
jgi:hypothetical protein